MKLILTIFAFVFMVQNSFAAVTRIFAMGDAPYDIPKDYSRFEAMLAELNTLKPDFAVHVGDIKGGSHPCTENIYQKVLDYFSTVTVPMMFTPGDNDWTDCSRTGADPVERLAYLRKKFYPNTKSLGMNQMALEVQSNEPFEKYVENRMWTVDGVIYSTLHVVGSNNNNLVDLPAMVAEYTERNAANLSWLDQTFERAENTKAPAVVIFMQANPGFELPSAERTGFNDLIAAFLSKARRFQKPILLVQGDAHTLIFDQPLWIDPTTFTGHQQNFYRLQVPGYPMVQGVMVKVDPSRKMPFQFDMLDSH